MTIHLTDLKKDVDIKTAQPAVATLGITDQPGVYRDYFKRAKDLVFVIIMMPVVLPLLVIMAFLVALDGHNPFYCQDRIGRNGRVFRMWKLRTMVPNAQELLARHLAQSPEARAEWRVNQKLKDDPRITPIGRVLRKCSLDELPQLFNVLTGDMSLVGPRPMMVSQQSIYSGKAYYRMRPGITGLWQVSDRNDCSFAKRVSFDNEYDNVVSFRTDFSILFQTVAVVLRGTGY